MYICTHLVHLFIFVYVYTHIYLYIIIIIIQAALSYQSSSTDSLIKTSP